jgi:plasmid stabilization system protein ParE
MTLRFTRGARVDFMDALDHYLGESEIAATDFLLELDRCLDRIHANPKTLLRISAARSKREVRRLPLDRFPYSVIYEIMNDALVIRAVAHYSRRPNYWRRRNS